MPTQHLTGLDILVVEAESLLGKRIATQLESLGTSAAGTRMASTKFKLRYRW